MKFNTVKPEPLSPASPEALNQKPTLHDPGSPLGRQAQACACPQGWFGGLNRGLEGFMVWFYMVFIDV